MPGILDWFQRQPQGLLDWAQQWPHGEGLLGKPMAGQMMDMAQKTRGMGPVEAWNDPAYRNMATNMALALQVNTPGGLPMDAASKAARAADQGYTKDVYHGTNNQFTAFDPKRTQDLGIHVGTAEQAANAITPLGKYADGANIMPLKMRLNNPLRLKDDFSTLGRRFQGRAKTLTLDTPGFRVNDAERTALYEAAKRADKARTSGGGDFSLRLTTEGKKHLSAYEQAEREFWDVIENSARRQGYDGFVYKNKVEGPGDSFIVLDANQLRSRFAAFDPAKADSPDLMAAALPFGLLGGGALGGGLLNTYNPEPF